MNTSKAIVLAMMLAYGAGQAAATDTYADTDSIRHSNVVSIVDSINCGGTVSISQPAAFDAIMKRTATANGATANGLSQQHVATRAGYRIQVFDDNNPRTARAQAQAKEAQMLATFPQWRTYLTFNSPYWQLKVGDFRTRVEAEAAMVNIRDAFPSLSGHMRLVREKINITE
jgi:hypothetical protein